MTQRRESNQIATGRRLSFVTLKAGYLFFEIAGQSLTNLNVLDSL